MNTTRFLVPKLISIGLFAVLLAGFWSMIPNRPRSTLASDVASDWEVPGSIFVSDFFEPDFHSKIRETLFLLTSELDLLGPVKILPMQSRSDFLAFSDPKAATIYLSENIANSQLPHILAHEIGHMVDHRIMNTTRRQAYCEKKRIANCASWDDSTYKSYSASDLVQAWRNSPAEDFAEEFVRYALDGSYVNRTNYSGADLQEAFWRELLAD